VLTRMIERTETDSVGGVVVVHTNTEVWVAPLSLLAVLDGVGTNAHFACKGEYLRWQPGFDKTEYDW
jgi:hypothetical protein